jgi:hypothetical protein
MNDFASFITLTAHVVIVIVALSQPCVKILTAYLTWPLLVLHTGVTDRTIIPIQIPIVIVNLILTVPPCKVLTTILLTAVPTRRPMVCIAHKTDMPRITLIISPVMIPAMAVVLTAVIA